MVSLSNLFTLGLLGVAAVSFNSTYINSTYDNYRVICYGLSTASDNQDIALRMSVDNGSNFATHVGCMNYTQINHNGVAQATVGNRTSITMGSDEEADAGGEGGGGRGAAGRARQGGHTFSGISTVL